MEPDDIGDELARARLKIDTLEERVFMAQLQARVLGGAPQRPRIDRFVLERKLGAGGMGTVWLAQDERLSRRVALKLVRGAHVHASQRLHIREARGLARICHPNVVTVFDVGEHEGRVWLAMEFVSGRTLWDCAGQFERAEVLAHWIAAGRGLAAVHTAGLVHRDIKPENIMLGDDGRVRVIDLGLVRPTAEASPQPGRTQAERPSSMVRTQGFVGTSDYAAPEQLHGEQVDARADQYSFCLSLFEALRSAPDPRPLPAKLVTILERGASLAASDRFPDIDALLGALEATALDLAEPDSATRATLRLPQTLDVRDLDATLPRDADHPSSNPSSDSWLAHYQLLDELGRGGMGVVYKARDTRLNRHVAIKRLHGQPSGTQLSRFIREAQAMAKLAHPNVIPVYEIGEQADCAYIVMEYVEGWTLRNWQAQPQTQDELLGVYEDAARGLSAAHEKDLVHRDFKPDNVMVGADGRVRVMDFGLARASGESGDVDPLLSMERVGDEGPHAAPDPGAAFEPLTRTGALLGTPAYMSPEQYRGERATPESDQFGFCVALYEALYGERPFAGNTITALCTNVEAGRIREAPPGTEVPTWLRDVVCIGLAAKASERAPSMQAWLDALLEAKRAHSSEARVVGFSADRASEVWERLLPSIARGKVVPIIGPRLLQAAHGGTHDTAKHLADRKHYPMAAHEWDDLPRVLAYLSVKESRYNVVEAFQGQLLQSLLAQHQDWLPSTEMPPAVRQPKLGRLLSLVGDRLRERSDDPYRVLAELPASVYVTTNFDPLLERAIRAGGRRPQQVVTRWRHKRALSAAGEIFDEPTQSAPLVYHVFGAFGPDVEHGLVLTEDDYFDYLIASQAGELMPPEVESALVNNSLLFLGFRLTDWHFRVLFRLMMNLPGRDRLKNYCHVAAQIDPDLHSMADVAGAKAYLAEYFGKEANIDIYWGSAEQFLGALSNELAAGELSIQDQSPEAIDEWNF